MTRRVHGAGFVAAMAWREVRAARRRLALLTAPIAVGVAALVAIHAFGDGVRESVRREARSLLGADLALGSARPFSPAAERQLAELETAAARAGQPQLARVTSFAAMARREVAEGAARLVQVTAVEGEYPFYGSIATQPAGAWTSFRAGRNVLVDPSLLPVLDAQPGDTLALGEARFRIAGTLLNYPGDVGLRSAFGPRVVLPARFLDETRLLGFGSRARYEAYLALPASVDPQRLAERFRSRLGEERVSLRTVDDDQRRLDRVLGRLTRFLGLVGFVALLLGGIGVASGIHVFVREKSEALAVLRCLGARSGQVFAVYLVQAVALGLAGSVIGVVLGQALAQLLPPLLEGLLPVAVSPGHSPAAIGLGLVVGLWVTTTFAALPLVGVREVSPLAALRGPFETASRPRPRARLAVVVVIAASVAGLAALQAGDVATGLAFAAGAAAALAVLWATALALVRLLHRRFPQRLPYLWRQGLANLYRPANQTVTVVLSLGFGAFLLATLYLVQHNLLRGLRADSDPTRPNLAFFDVQPDQLAALEARLAETGYRPAPAVPIVPMRIQSLRGREATELLAGERPEAAAGPPRWALRREYRSTYRDARKASERVVAGAWWEEGAGARAAAAGAPVPVSLDAGLARELGVGVGDGIVWDVQGVPVASVVASLREVDWARFEPNFFAVFADGPLRAAPQTFVSLVRVDDAAARGRLLRSVAGELPNVSALDLAQVQQALETLVARVALGIRFMALFSLLTGAAVLFGAVAASRLQRVREAVLLKTLGATRGQVRQIALAEYLFLGTLATGVGLALAGAAGWALMRFVFDSALALPLAPAAALAAGVVALTVAIGLWNSVAAFRRTPLEILRAQ